MHSESIHVYFIPNFRVKLIASWKVRGRQLQGMRDLNTFSVAFPSLRGRWEPQQWLRQMYCAVSFCGSCNLISWSELNAARSNRRVGSLPLPALLQVACWRVHSCNCREAHEKAALDAVCPLLFAPMPIAFHGWESLTVSAACTAHLTRARTLGFHLMKRRYQQ
jgi:hypothetical protein